MAEQSKNPIDAAVARAQTLAQRPVFRFSVPKEMQDLVLPGGTPVVSMGLVELSPHELRMVVKAAGDDGTAITEQQIIHALVVVNCDEYGAGGLGLSPADGSADKFVGSMHPQILELAAQAFNSLHSVKKEQSQSFLTSRKAVTRQ